MVVSEEVIINCQSGPLQVGPWRNADPMPPPTVSGNSKRYAVGCGNRSRHSSDGYAPRGAAETHDFSEDVVHHADSEKAVAEMVADCFRL